MWAFFGPKSRLNSREIGDLRATILPTCHFRIFPTFGLLGLVDQPTETIVEDGSK